MGSLNKGGAAKVKRFSKIVDIDGMSRPQVKNALDQFLNKGWMLGSIYVESGVARAVMIRTEEE